MRANRNLESEVQVQLYIHKSIIRSRSRGKESCFWVGFRVKVAAFQEMLNLH